MNCICISALLVLTSSMVGEPEEVRQIYNWMSEVRSMIEERVLVERYIVYTHKTISGIGMPENSVTGWFDQVDIEDSPPDFEEIPLYIENHYQHAGVSGLEEYYFMPDGEMVCCVSMLFTGFDGEYIYTDTFYFDDGELIFWIGERGPI